jgi:hypothetical protein
VEIIELLIGIEVMRCVGADDYFLTLSKQQLLI